MSFIGAVIVKRQLWLERDRASYFGSLFIHIGVLFQQPSLTNVIAIGEPLIAIRYGNALWTSQRFNIWAFLWPRLIWSLDGYSDTAKLAVVAKEPWRSVRHMVSFRAKGAYSYSVYRQFFSQKSLGSMRLMLVAVALLPGPGAHVFGTLALRIMGQLDGLSGYDLFAGSPYVNAVSRYFARKTAWIKLPSREEVCLHRVRKLQSEKYNTDIAKVSVGYD
jgi:abequosyltransferase